MSNLHSFSDFIRSHGYEPKHEIIAGRWVRFGRKLAISAKLYDDGLGGYLHDWRSGEKHYWFANTDAMSPS
jgi:putative DNA primase/helicase